MRIRTLVAWGDWSVEIINARRFVVQQPDEARHRPGTIDFRFHVRLLRRGIPVAHVHSDTMARPVATFDWLNSAVQFQLWSDARIWRRDGGLGHPRRSADATDDARTTGAGFLHMLVRGTAELQQWPAFDIGTSFNDPPPVRDSEADEELPSIDLDGRRYRLLGWADGKVCYYAPDGSEQCVTDDPALLERLVRTCAAYYAGDDA